MAASPKNGTFIFRGASGQLYTYSFYISDVAAAFSTWATTAAAASTSVNFVSAPENMQLVDARISAAGTDTTTLVLWLDDAPVRNALIAQAAIADALPKRSFSIPGISKGRKVQFAQA